MRIVRQVWLATLVSSCPAIGGAGCDNWRPVFVTPPPAEYRTQFAPGERPGDYDRMTTETARTVLGNNLFGRRACGW